MFEIAAPEIEEIVTVKVVKFQNNCKRCGNKNNSETIGRWKKNPSVEPYPFLKKVDRKPVALAKTFLIL